jgi:hypothetical protein
MRVWFAMGVVFALAAATALAADSAGVKGVNQAKEFTVLGKTVAVTITSPGGVTITVDGVLRYQGGPGIPYKFYGYAEKDEEARVLSERNPVAVEFGPVIDLKDHSVLVFETWHKAKTGLIGRIWLECVWPNDKDEYVDGMFMRHDGTYSSCLESLAPGADPLTAKTAVKSVEKTSDTSFRYRCGPAADEAAHHEVYQRVLGYYTVSEPIPEAK